MTDPARSVPEEGAGSGEQPVERQKRPELGSWRLMPSRRSRDGEWKGEKGRDRPERAVRTLCTVFCSFRLSEEHQQQQPQQRGHSSDCRAPQVCR